MNPLTTYNKMVHDGIDFTDPGSVMRQAESSVARVGELLSVDVGRIIDTIKGGWDLFAAFSSACVPVLAALSAAKTNEHFSPTFLALSDTSLSANVSLGVS